MTERSESERAELEALADEYLGMAKAHRAMGEKKEASNCELIVTALRLAAQDQKPVALAHVRLEDDGLFADLEVLDGTNLQPSMSPVALYLSPPPAAHEDDPSADERWNAGLDFAMQQLCTVMGVDPKDVTWDAATETVDGDVRSVIWNILRVKMGEDWKPAPVAANASAEPALNWQLSDDAKARVAEINDNLRNAALNASNIVAGSSNASAEARWRLVPLKPTGQQIEQAAYNLADEFGPEYVLEHKEFAMAAYEELVTAIPVSAGREKLQLMDALEVLKQARLYVWLDTNIPKSKTAMLSMIDAILSQHPHASDCDKQGER